jgi:hypothetical protein
LLSHPSKCLCLPAFSRSLMQFSRFWLEFHPAV